MRPHQHKKARVMRLKPRHNPNVNDYWICDKGRYNYRFIDENRIMQPQLNNDLISWDQAVDTIVTVLKPLHNLKRTNRIGVIASAQLTNEDLFVIRRFFKGTLKGTHVDFRVPEKPGDSDTFLIKADKNPNTAGAVNILQPEVTADEIVKKARAGDIDLLYVFGQDLASLYGKEALYQISKNVKLFVYQGSNVNATCAYAHLNLPSSVYAEKEGTFINFQQRVQRIWPAFPPIGEAKGDWEILSLISDQLGVALTYQRPSEIFKDIAAALAPFSEMTYEKISDKGMVLKA
jgi:NADH-quinone oxidoreductase subunit G